MELVSFAKEILHNIAEQVVSYQIGQTALRYLDRALWVVEKSARWAVPPPLDQDDRPQAELVRPLPWVFFLTLLVILRVTRESISLLNLALGKPPLRSVDVVIYIQSKRRYLRTLKYQGNRAMRARATSAQPQEPWYRNLQKLFEFTMCFRRNSYYGNNNTTSVSNNEEILVVKRRRPSPTVPTGEPAMEKLIEKIMVDLDAESDRDSEPYTLTNITKSDTSEDTCESGDESNQSAPIKSNDISNASTSEITDVRIDISPPKHDFTSSTPEKGPTTNNLIDYTTKPTVGETKVEPKEFVVETKVESFTSKEESQQFIMSEKCEPLKPKKSPNMKIANGLASRITPTKKKGKITLDGSLDGGKENIRHQIQTHDKMN